MPRKRDGTTMAVQWAFIAFVVILTFQACDAASNRRRESNRRSSAVAAPYLPSPSVETLSELAEAMGAAGFEHYTEGSAKPIVKRLIADNREPGLDEVAYQGIVGKAGVDFPAFPSIPTTGFNCRNVATGYYADLETDCQVFHICDSHRKISFLCPNGTIFSQSHLICDWWFKVDCASAPTLYESSAEQYSLAQRKVRLQSLVNQKNIDQQINADASNINTKTEERQQLRKSHTNPIIRQDPIPSSTERQSRYRPKQYDSITPLNNIKATSRSFQALFADNNFNSPTQRTYDMTTRSNGFEKRRKNLVQLIANNFGQLKTTLPSYTDASTYRSTALGDYNSIKEMQVVAESASFANNNNRQFLQQNYNNINFKPYPVYSPTPNTRQSKATTPTFTTAFGQEFNRHGKSSTPYANSYTMVTKRPTLVPYTKEFINDKREPYTRPGVHLLKEYLDKEKNRTQEQASEARERSDNAELKPMQYESVTKIPMSKSEDSYFTAAASSDRYDVFSSNNNFNHISTEPTYFDKSDRSPKKLDLSAPEPTTNTEKYFGRRPGLIVPPSLTPKTLHSLAIYYATALDNLSTTTESDDNQTSTLFPSFNRDEIDEALPSLLSQQTIEKYSNLFSQHGDNADILQELKLDTNGTDIDFNDDLSGEQSQGPLSSSPQIRELAQVFTHALSAYLQDPIQFRKVLSDIRPTQPGFGDMVTTPSSFTDDITNADVTTIFSEEDDELLGFSDDNKSRLPSLAQLRDAKIQTTTPAANSRFGDVFEINTTPDSYTLPSSTLTNEYTTTKSPFRCCGSISASYTSASTEKDPTTTSLSITSKNSSDDNTFTGSSTIVSSDILYTTTTENSYTVPKYGGFQNNSSSFAPYGNGVQPSDAKPLNSEQYKPSTNLPPTWASVDNTESNYFTATIKPVTNSHDNIFEVNNLISSTTSLPTTSDGVLIRFGTESDSSELENEEELQRAQSQSFILPTNNNIQRHGKNIMSNYNKNEGTNNIKKPSSDLELPSAIVQYDVTTTLQPSVTPFFSSTPKYIPDEESFATISPTAEAFSTAFESEKINKDFPNQQQWSNNFDNWHSTVILDPITLNDGLSAPQQNTLATGPDYQYNPKQTTPWEQNFGPTTTPSSDFNNRYRFTNGQNSYQQNSEQYLGFSNTYKQPTAASLTQEPISSLSKSPTTRGGRLLKNNNGLEIATSVPTIVDSNIVEVAKEIMNELNGTTTDKLMDVMKKTKSKTVRRLILLLVQTCDDDHNKTAEASKKALLEALVAVSQKDATTTEAVPESITTTNIPDLESNRITNSHRRMDRVSEVTFSDNIRPRNSQRTGKSIRVDPSAINSLTHPSTLPTPTKSNSPKSTTEVPTQTTAFTSTTPSLKSVPSGRRGVRKFLVRSSPVDSKIISTTDKPIAEARVLSSSADNKPSADTRALELLRSLYTIAARWG